MQTNEKNIRRNFLVYGKGDKNISWGQCSNIPFVNDFTFYYKHPLYVLLILTSIFLLSVNSGNFLKS